MNNLEFKNAEWADSLTSLLDYVYERTSVAGIIAGGAVRDGILGGSVRDIDLYVPANQFYEVGTELYVNKSETSQEELLLDFADIGGCTTFVQGDAEYDHQYIWHTREDTMSKELSTMFPALRDYPVNLIGVDAGAYGGSISGQAIVSLFNLSTSQCWMEARREGFITGYSGEFKTSVETRVCKILRSSWGRTGTVKAVKKFLDKYPDFALNIPPSGVIRDNRDVIDATLFRWEDQE